MIDSTIVKQWGRECGADLVGIASAGRFRDVPGDENPRSIKPDAESVIVLAFRYLNGALQGIGNGSNWGAFSGADPAGMSAYMQEATYCFARRLESAGFEATPLIRHSYDLRNRGVPVSPGVSAPDVILNMEYAAYAAGLGEMGLSKVFLSGDFGPRQRLGAILTDAELEPDPIRIGRICDRCTICARDCPGGAIHPKQPVSFDAVGLHWECADLELGRCKLTHFGLNRVTSPHFVKSFPGIYLPMDQQGNTWVEGWNFGHALFSSVPTYKAFSAYPIAICGARGCIISCMNHLEKRKRIRNLFGAPFSVRPPWRLPEKPLNYHKDHHGFVYDPEHPDRADGGNVQSNWY